MKVFHHPRPSKIGGTNARTNPGQDFRADIVVERIRARIHQLGDEARGSLFWLSVLNVAGMADEPMVPRI